MSGFEICESCGRHVRVEDGACPFCRARTRTVRASTRFAMALPLLFLGVACGGKSPLSGGDRETKPGKRWQEPKLHKVDERPQEPWQPIPDEEEKQDAKQHEKKDAEQVDSKTVEPDDTKTDDPPDDAKENKEPEGDDRIGTKKPEYKTKYGLARPKPDPKPKPKPKYGVPRPKPKPKPDPDDPLKGL